MSKHNSVKLILTTVIGAVSTLIADMIGGFTPNVDLLITLMAVDIIAAIMIILVFKENKKSSEPRLSSVSFWKGLCRKGLTFAVIIVANKCDEVLGIGYIRDAVIYAFIANEAFSLFEHAAVVGLKIPEPLKDSMEVFRNKGDKKE